MLFVAQPPFVSMLSPDMLSSKARPGGQAMTECESDYELSMGYYMDVEDIWIGGRRCKEAVITYVAANGDECRVEGIKYVAPAHPKWAFSETDALAILEPAVEFLRDYKRRTGKRFEIVDERSLARVVAVWKRQKRVHASAGVKAVSGDDGPTTISMSRGHTKNAPRRAGRSEDSDYG
ncbi:hypothetical protein D5400_03505 [Georhizobium profundi]|uniref:Uncharacterized protein n=1 Tax=Georhizobium profundi TaxID=2341112 RepID=A0A3Q8XNQ6_9HYPH|nr:hypothetical protein [Georhizobium profundi]AZN70463.1 hypothetical protein D5400_03505 [Georhizobium profundi]